MPTQVGVHRTRLARTVRFVALGTALLVGATSIAVPPPDASAAPSTPRFGSSIEGYPAYQAQSTCDPATKPGVADFRDLLNRTYGYHTSGIVRACDLGGTSEHKEGRALDYHFNAFDPAQAAKAADLINWLLATDRHGNANAMARRLGIMYLIWNRRIWQRGSWSTYYGTSPHTDHIHVSFSWAGAWRQTSWWHPLPWGDRVSDFSGDGHADILGVNSTGELLYYPNNGLKLSSPARIGHGWNTFRHVMAADFSGDGHADILGVNSTGELLYYPNNGLKLSSPARIGHGWNTFRHVMAADWSGDRQADVLGVDSTGDLWYYPHTGTGLGARVKLGHGWGTFRHVMAADFSGDGYADILGVDSTGDLWYYPHTGTGLGARVKLGHGWGTFRHVMAADFSGDGYADILGVDSAGDLWYYPNNGLSLSSRTKIGNGWGSFTFVM